MGIKNGWYEIQGEDFWAFYKNGSWTGYTVSKLVPYYTGKSGYHIRNSPANKDIITAPSLEKAKLLVESYA